MQRILFLTRILPLAGTPGGDMPILNYQMKALNTTDKVIDLLFLKRKKSDIEKIKESKEFFGFNEYFYAGIEPKINLRCLSDWVFKKRSYIFNRFYSKSYSNKLLELVKTGDYNTLVFITSYMYINVALNKALQNEIKNRNIKCVLGVTVLEYMVRDKYLSNNGDNISLIKKYILQREQRLLKDIELSFIKRADRNYLVGKEEYDFICKILSEHKEKIYLLEIIPSIEEYFYSVPEKEEQNSIYFVGSYSWSPNVDAVKYFVKNIFPSILERNKTIKFYIIGIRASEEIKNLHDGKNIFFMGEVKSVFDEIQKYSVLVVPLRIGGGTRLKILESIAWGKAVVTTSIGSEGINLHGESPVILADEPKVFAAKVVELLENNSARIELKEAARNFALKYYILDKFRDNMLEILEFEQS